MFAQPNDDRFLPAFGRDGLLPAGVHVCHLDEFEDVFVWSPRRRAIYAQMGHGLGVLYESGYRLIVFGGAFISASPAPADFMALYDSDPVAIDTLDARLSHFDPVTRARAYADWGGHFFPASFRAKGTGAAWLQYLSNDVPSGQRGLIALSLT